MRRDFRSAKSCIRCGQEMVQSGTAVGRAMIRGRRLACEALEERHLLSVFTVTEIGDSHLETGAMFANPVPGEIDTYALPSLRAAVEAANQHSGDDTIQFDPSLAGETIVLEDGELLLFDATAKTTIEGLGADQLAVSGDNTSRIFSLAEVRPRFRD